MSLLERFKRMATGTLRKTVVRFGPHKNVTIFNGRAAGENVQRIVTAFVRLLQSGGESKGSDLMKELLGDDELEKIIKEVVGTARCSDSGQLFDFAGSGEGFVSSSTIFYESILNIFVSSSHRSIDEYLTSRPVCRYRTVIQIRG